MSAPAPGAEGRTRLSVTEGVAHLVFDRPEARNAMTWRMYEDLADGCAQIAARPDVKVAVLRGAGGKAFVAGTDIAQFEAFSSGEDGIAYEAKVERYVGAVEALPVPTLAVVEGFAVGGGLMLANACDLRIATPGTRFGAPIAATLGNCLSLANLARLTATLGEPWVRRMLLLAEMPSAEMLAPAGYVADIVAPEALDGAVDALCARLKGHAPLTLSATRIALARLRASERPSDDDLIAQVYGSADFKAGIAAFKAKRKAAWAGR